jgi:hypothetical protein
MEPTERQRVDQDHLPVRHQPLEYPMNGIVYLVGLIVIIMFILSMLGLR